jgi:hypothetical protein
MSSGSRAKTLGWVLTLSLALALPVKIPAGPPFLTDDPQPVDFRNWEVYVFGQGDRTSDVDSISGPAVEMNYGVAPNVQLHAVFPLASATSTDGGWRSGYGDTEVGIKYRFFGGDTDSEPQVGIFPLAELPTGNSSKGLGNGLSWYKVPIWAQQTWGKWTTYGGGGEALNSAAGQKNSGFAGWLLQRDIGRYLTLGGELFRQGKRSTEGRASTLANAGGYLKFSDSFNILFSAGRSLSGERHVMWYLGLYWTGGPKKAGLR